MIKINMTEKAMKRCCVGIRKTRGSRSGADVTEFVVAQHTHFVRVAVGRSVEAAVYNEVRTA